MVLLRALPILVVVLLTSVAAARAATVPQVTDFHCFWTAARMVLDGADPYDPTRWAMAIGGPFADVGGVLRSAPCPGAFGYPLSTAVAFVPLAALPESVAAAVWAIVLVGATAVGVGALWRAVDGRPSGLPLFAVIVGCAQPLWLTIINAQFGGLLLGLLGLVAIAQRGVRERLGAVALAALTLKPHVVSLVFVAAAYGAIRERRFGPLALAAAVAGGLALIATAVQPGWPAAWAAQLLGTRREMLPRQATAWSLAADTIGDGRIGALFIFAVVLTAAVALRGARSSGVDRVGLAICGSLLITPYAGSHDQVLLALPWAIVLTAAVDLPSPARPALLLGLVFCASVLPWTLYAYALRARPDEATAWLVVAATTLLVALAIRLRAVSAPSSQAASWRTRARERPMREASPDS